MYKNERCLIFDESGNLTNVVINGNLFVKGFVIANSPNDQGTYGIMDPFRKNVDNIRTTDLYKTYSDRRLKNVGAFNNDGLDKIRELKVYNYTFKKDKKKIPQVGVIAQDLQKIFPNAVKKNKNGYFMIRHDDMFYAMLNAIKELDRTMQYISIKVRYILIDLHKQC